MKRNQIVERENSRIINYPCIENGNAQVFFNDFELLIFAAHDRNLHTIVDTVYDVVN